MDDINFTVNTKNNSLSTTALIQNQSPRQSTMLYSNSSKGNNESFIGDFDPDDIMNEPLPESFEAFLGEPTSSVSTSSNTNTVSPQTSITKGVNFFQPLSTQPFPAISKINLPNDENTVEHSNEEESIVEEGEGVDVLKISLKEIHEFLIENKTTKLTNAELSLAFFQHVKLRGADVEGWENYYKKRSLEAINRFLNQINADIDEIGTKLTLNSLKNMTVGRVSEIYDDCEEKKLLYNKADEKADEYKVLREELNHNDESFAKKTSNNRKKKR